MLIVDRAPSPVRTSFPDRARVQDDTMVWHFSTGIASARCARVPTQFLGHELTSMRDTGFTVKRKRYHASIGTLAAAIAVSATLIAPADTSATPTVTFLPTFSEADLGEAAMVSATITFTGSEYFGSPEPLTRLILHLPAGLEGSSSGFPICEPETLRQFGPIKCPHGSEAAPVTSAITYVTLGGERVEEQAEVWSFFGSDESVSFFIDGHTPVSLELLTTGSLRADSAPYGRLLELSLPLIESVPGAPYASFKALTLAFGRSYAEGISERYSVIIPRECPAEGFAWGLEGGFMDGTSVFASYRSPCPPAAAPILGQRQGVQVTAGTVTVRLPGTTTFVPIAAAGTVPNGSELETTHGSALITAATSSPGKTESAQVRGGRFVMHQDATHAAETHLALSLPLNGCASAVKRGHGVRTASNRPQHQGPKSRHLWVSEHGGSWGTNGRYVSTTVEGTSWLTIDQCKRSEVKVVAGRVRVHDLVRDKTVTVTAGENYTAVARRRG